MSNVTLPKELTGRTQGLYGTLHGGLYLDLPPTDIPDVGWSDGWGMVVDSNYCVRPYLGRTLLADLTVVLEDLPEDLRIYGIAEHRSFGSTRRLYIFIGDKVAVYDGVTWAWATLPGGYSITPSRWHFSMMAGLDAEGHAQTQYLICTAADNRMLAIDEAGTLTAPDTSSFYGTPLKPKYSLVYKGRLWIFGDARFADSVFGSYAADPTVWTPPGESSPADPQEQFIGRRDGEAIVGGIAKYDLAFFMKERSIWYLDAREPDSVNWSVVKLLPGVGGMLGSGYSLQDIGNDAVYAGPNGNLNNLRDTERAGQFAAGSLSAGQVQSYLRGFRYGECTSVVDPRQDWYILAMTESGASGNRNTAMVVYDFGKASIDGRGRWYRVPAISVYDAVLGTDVVQNGRACFALCSIFDSYGNLEVLSGGYTGRLYREFSGLTESLDDGNEGMIQGTVIGKHQSVQDYSEAMVNTVAAQVIFDGVPVGSSVFVGALVDPLIRNLNVLAPVSMEGGYLPPCILDVSVSGDDDDVCDLGEGYMDVYPTQVHQTEVATKGRTFAACITTSNAQVRFMRLFMSITPGRV